jgi:hypothetical protein
LSLKIQGDETAKREAFTKGFVEQAGQQHPDYNVVIVHPPHTASGEYIHQHQELPMDPAGIRTIGYDIYLAKKGRPFSLELHGDGGYINWAYVGEFDRNNGTIRSIVNGWSDNGLRDIPTVLLRGGFRQTLNGMSADDQRNTLIVELANRTRDTVPFYQSLNDADLTGAGALLVYLRRTSNNNDRAIKMMSADDMRNTVISGLWAPTGRRDLQALRNLDLIQLSGVRF